MASITAKITGSFVKAVFFERAHGEDNFDRHDMTDISGTWQTDPFDLPTGDYDSKYIVLTGPGAQYNSEIAGATPASKQTGTVPRDGEIIGGFSVA